MKMIKYIMHYAPSKILPGLINFIGLTVYARIFTQEEYGRYAYVFATLTLIESMLFPWIRMSIARFYQKYKKQEKAKEYESFTMFIFLVISVVLIVAWILFFNIYPVDNELKQLYFLGLFVILSQSLFEQMMSLARAKLESKIFLFSMIIKAILKLILVTILVLAFNFNEAALFIGIIVSHVVPLVFYLKKYSQLNVSYLKINKSFFKETFNYGIPLTFSFMLVFIINSSDRILIKYFINNEAVGLYSLPYEFTNFTLTNVFMVFSLAFFPIIVRELEHSGLTKARNIINQYSNILLTFTIPTTIFICVYASELANLFLGSNYNSQEAILIIQLISISSFFAGLKAYFFDYAFQLGKNTYKQIIPVFVSAITNIILNIIMLPTMGVKGAVIGSLISYIIGIVLSVFIGYKVFPMKLQFKQVTNIIIINMIFLLLLVKLPLFGNGIIQLIFVGIIGGGIYIALMIVFNVINVRKLILTKFNKRK